MSTVTLRTLEFIIPFGTPVQLRIIDYDGTSVGSYICKWPKIGGRFGYEIIDVWPCYDKQIGSILMITVKATKSLA